MATFRKVNLTISKKSGYGQYEISAQYKGKAIAVHSTDSEAYDWLNDDSNKEKHQDAKRACYSAIVSAYNREFKY